MRQRWISIKYPYIRVFQMREFVYIKLRPTETQSTPTLRSPCNQHRNGNTGETIKIGRVQATAWTYSAATKCESACNVHRERGGRDSGPYYRFAEIRR